MSVVTIVTQRVTRSDRDFSKTHASAMAGGREPDWRHELCKAKALCKSDVRLPDRRRWC